MCHTISIHTQRLVLLGCELIDTLLIECQCGFGDLRTGLTNESAIAVRIISVKARCIKRNHWMVI